MRAPFACESIACLVLTHLLLLVGLSGIVVCFAACLTFCGMGESLGLHSSHLISSLGKVLLGCGHLLLSIRPLSLFTLGLWADWYSCHATALFLP